MRDSYEDALRGIEVPNPPPALIEAAREQASTIATETDGRRTRRTATVGLSAVAAVAIAFTPPGQAATDWIAEVAGIGEEPTLEHPAGVPGTAVVFGTGTAPDGTPFEIVAERLSAETFNERLREVRGDDDVQVDSGLICPRIDLPSHRVSSGEYCSVLGSGPGPSALSAMGMSPPREGASAPAPLWGNVGPEVAEVRIDLVMPGKEARPLDVTLAHLSGELQQRVGADHPFGIFVTFPPIQGLPPISENGARLELVAYNEAGDKIERQSLHIGSGAFGMPAHPPILRDLERIRELGAGEAPAGGR